MTVPADVQRVFDEWVRRGRPSQPAVTWQRDLWIASYPALTHTLTALPAQLDRTTVRAIVEAKPLTANGMFETMIATYAWGWSVSGVGIGRARRVLDAGADQVGPKLLRARQIVREQGPMAGYCALAREHRIRGLGPAFGTKFLYFCSADAARAPIVDELVATWLNDRALLTIASTRWVRRDYQAYLDALTAWGAELALDAHQVEELIFSDEARRRGLPGWGD